MLSALARRAVPATANRLSSAPAASGARRAMGSAQSFVSFGAAVRCMRLVLLRGNRRWYSLHAHYQRFLPPRADRSPGCCVLAGNWTMESNGNVTVDALYTCAVSVCSQSLTFLLSILSRLMVTQLSLTACSTSTPPTILWRPSSISTKRTTNELKWLALM